MEIGEIKCEADKDDKELLASKESQDEATALHPNVWLEKPMVWVWLWSKAVSYHPQPLL